MAFLPKNPSSSSVAQSVSGESTSANLLNAGNNSSISALVDQITDAVRQKLLSEGLPLSTPMGSPKSAPQAGSTSMQHLIREGAVRVGHHGDSPFQPQADGSDQELASHIDHTLLKPDATLDEIKRVCSEARKYHFATVCVNSNNIPTVAELLKGSSVKPIAVVGFPLGAASTASKAFEAREAVKAGAQEIDMVINIGALKSKDYGFVLDDIKKVVEASNPAPVKVILETSSLTREEKIVACALSKAANAAFVKTSTGFGSGGATAEDVSLMRQIVGDVMGVKASGGIRTHEDATKMIEAGANRIGASASVAMVLKTAKNPTTDAGDKSGKRPYKSSLY